MIKFQNIIRRDTGVGTKPTEVFLLKNSTFIMQHNYTSKKFHNVNILWYFQRITVKFAFRNAAYTICKTIIYNNACCTIIIYLPSSIKTFIKLVKSGSSFYSKLFSWNRRE